MSAPITVVPRTAPLTSAANSLPKVSTFLPCLVLIWAIGVVVLSVWNLAGWVTLRQLRSRSTRPAPPDVVAAARRLAARFELSRPVEVLQSALATTPLVLGAFRPVILLPASVLTRLSAAELESILAHELAHVRRHDYLVNLCQSVIETVLFYHPAVWWISRRMRGERELCCDDLALAVTRDRATYATALAAVASIRVSVLAPAANGGNLLQRLRRVLGVVDADSGRPSRGLAGAILTLCIVGAIAAPHLQPRAKAADKAAADGDTVEVRGRVLDPAGNPAKGAKVTVAPAWPNIGERTHAAVIATTTSGADGRFTISFKKSEASAFALGFGWSAADLWKKAQVVASADGEGLDWQQFDHVNAAGELELHLGQDVALQGRLVDLEGRPVAGVEISVSGMTSHIITDAAKLKNPPANYRGLESPLAAAGREDRIVTDADGRFRIAGLGKERNATLEFRSDAVAISPVRVMTREGPPVSGAWGSGDRAAQFWYYGSTFELSAPPARVVVGTVRDAMTHEPITGARITIDYGMTRSKAVSDAQGRYRLGGLEREGSVSIRVSADDGPYIPMIADAPKATGVGPVTVNIDLYKGVWITGRVVDQQTKAAAPMSINYLPLASNAYASKVPVFRQGWAQPPCNTETKPDGSYRLIGAPGPGVVAVSGPSTSYSLGQGFDAIKSKDKGGHVATLLPRMVEPSWYTAAKEIDAAPDAVTEGVDFTLDPGGTVHVTCTDPDGKPLNKIQALGRRSGTGNAIYDAFDHAEFDAIGFTAGESRLVVVKDEQRHLAKIETVRLADAKDGKVTIRLEPVGYVTGRLVNPQHDPIRGGMLRADTYIPELKQSNRSGIAVPRADADGRFKLELPPGTRFVLGASPSPYGGRFKWVTEDLKVAPGQIKDLGNIELPEEMMK